MVRTEPKHGRPILDRPLLTLKEVSRGFHKTPDWFYRNRAALEAQGFPKPVIGKLYDAEAIDFWFNQKMAKDDFDHA